MNTHHRRLQRHPRRIFLLLLSLAQLIAPLAAEEATAGEALTLAVSPFANKTGDARFDAVSKGLADMLTTDLAVSAELKLVERERIAAVLAELKLGHRKAFDPKTAQRAGKMLGAELILVGSVTAWTPTLRIDARIVSVETGEVMVVASASGPQAQFFAVETQLAKKLLTGFGVRLSPLQRLKIDRAPTRSWQALAAYAKGLDASDRGDKEAAKRAFSAAIAADPAFARARQRLDKLSKRVAALERRTDAVERAGGLILRPSSAVEHWSNHKVHLSRGDKAKATAAAQAALASQPGAVDALSALCAAGVAAAGRAKVPPRRRKLVCALVAKRGAAAAKLSAAMVSGTTPAAETGLAPLTAEQVVPAYLRLRAITAPAYERAPGGLRAESVGLGLLLGAALQTKAGGAALDKAFLDAAQRAAARKFVTAHLQALTQRVVPGKQRRGSLWAQTLKVALIEHVGRGRAPPLLLQVRFAEPDVSDVRVSWKQQTWSLVTRVLPAGAEVAVWQVGVSEPAPTGPSVMTVTWLDGDRVRHTDTRTWPLRLTTNGYYRERGRGLGSVVTGRYPMLMTRFAPRAKADLGGQLLIDPVVGLWSEPMPAEAGRIWLRTMYAGRPSVWATGELLDRAWPGQGLSRLGIVRPVVYGTGAGGGQIRVLGSGRYFLERFGGKSQYVAESGALAAERGLHVRPVFSAPSAHTLALATARRRAAALRAWQDYIGALPQSAALWELSNETGLYAALWTACPLAGASGRSVKQLRSWTQLAARLQRARAGRPSWAPALLAVCGHRDALPGAWRRAEAADARGHAPGQRWRFRAEVATARVLGHGWPKAGGPEVGWVNAALAHAPADSLEVSLLTSAAVAARAGRPGVAVIRNTVAQARVAAPTNDALSAQLAVRPFWLDRDEVSAAAYAACVAAGGCREPTDVACASGLGMGNSHAFSAAQPTHCLPITPKLLPQNHVQYGDAARYCAWRGGRLPRAQELLTAALDGEGRAPWHRTGWRGAHGNLQDRVVCAWRGYGRRPRAGCDKGAPGAKLPWDRYGWIAPVGAHPAGESAHGIAHLAGNLREWVADGANSAFGCSFDESPNDPSACLRTVRAVPTYAAADVGFRCAYDGKPGRTARRPPRTRPARLQWARIPGGAFQLGELPVKPRDRRKSTPHITLERIQRRDVDAVVAAATGLTRAQVERFATKLHSLGLTGPLSARFLEEIVARGLWTRRATGDVLDAILAAVERFDTKPFKAAFGDNAYLAAARHRSGGDDRKMRALLWLDIQTRMLNQPRLPKPARSHGWSARHGFDCRDQQIGACVDATGTTSRRFNSDSRARPAQRVVVAPFRMMTTEVTQRRFAAVMKRAPSFFDCPTCAVERVSWADAAAFCRKIKGRLPTEAEWAFAAAGGKAERRYGPLGEVAWHLGNRKTTGAGAGLPPRTGTKRANAYGLHDMLGGVWEWTADRWLDASSVRSLARSLKPMEKSRIRNAPADAKPWCLRAYRAQRFAERQLDALPWVEHGRQWIACYDTEEAATAAVVAVLAKPPLGPSEARSKKTRPVMRTIVGGAWATDPRLVHRLARSPTMESQRSVFVGFRCVK